MQKLYSVSCNTITPPNNGNGEKQILWHGTARKFTEENLYIRHKKVFLRKFFYCSYFPKQNQVQLSHFYKYLLSTTDFSLAHLVNFLKHNSKALTFLQSKSLAFTFNPRTVCKIFCFFHYKKWNLIVQNSQLPWSYLHKLDVETSHNDHLKEQLEW